MNGATGQTNPQRQGLYSALLDGRPPLNVLGAVPTIAAGYSPLWSVNPAVWSRQATDEGRRARLTSQARVHELVRQGWITGPDGKPFGPAGRIVNCPVVERLQ